LIGAEQEHRHRLHFERLGHDCGHALQQLFGVERVHRHAAELDHELVVARTLHRPFDARVGADAAHRSHHIVGRTDAQRAERDLHHHLAAVGSFGHQFEFGAHRARLGRECVALPVGGVPCRHAIGHQRVHRPALQGAGGMAEQAGGGRVGEHDQALRIDHQYAVGVGVEEAAKDQQVVRVRQGWRAAHSTLTGNARM
jgi:hypothetical protein